MSNRMNNLAEQRITKLLDDNSFMEIGSLVTARQILIWVRRIRHLTASLPVTD